MTKSKIFNKNTVKGTVVECVQDFMANALIEFRPGLLDIREGFRLVVTDIRSEDVTLALDDDYRDIRVHIGAEIQYLRGDEISKLRHTHNGLVIQVPIDFRLFTVVDNEIPKDNWCRVLRLIQRGSHVHMTSQMRNCLVRRAWVSDHQNGIPTLTSLGHHAITRWLHSS